MLSNKEPIFVLGRSLTFFSDGKRNPGQLLLRQIKCSVKCVSYFSCGLLCITHFTEFP